MASVAWHSLTREWPPVFPAPDWGLGGAWQACVCLSVTLPLPRPPLAISAQTNGERGRRTSASSTQQDCLALCGGANHLPCPHPPSHHGFILVSPGNCDSEGIRQNLRAGRNGASCAILSLVHTIFLLRIVHHKLCSQDQ